MKFGLWGNPTKLAPAPEKKQETKERPVSQTAARPENKKAANGRRVQPRPNKSQEQQQQPQQESVCWEFLRSRGTRNLQATAGDPYAQQERENEQQTCDILCRAIEDSASGCWDRTEGVRSSMKEAANRAPSLTDAAQSARESVTSVIDRIDLSGLSSDSQMGGHDIEVVQIDMGTVLEAANGAQAPSIPDLPAAPAHAPAPQLQDAGCCDGGGGGCSCNCDDKTLEMMLHAAACVTCPEVYIPFMCCVMCSGGFE